MGFITDKERYNQVIDAWTHVNSNLKNAVMKHMTEADQGFNAVYMMLDSEARGFCRPDCPACWYARTDGEASEGWCRGCTDH